MKILILNSGRGWGGIETYSIVLAQTLLNEGHEVVLACRPGCVVEDMAAAAKIPTLKLHVRNAVDVLAVRRIAAILAEGSFDLLIANLGKEYWPATFAGKAAGVRTVLVRHQLDRIKPLTKLLLRYCTDSLIAVSEAVRKVLLEAGVPEEKVDVVYPGTDLSRFQFNEEKRAAMRKALGIAADDIVIGTTGKLHPGKGIYELLEAGAELAASFDNLKLLYVGDGDKEERQELERRIAAAQLQEKVILTGFRKDVQDLYMAMDVFALPSKYLESFGLVLVEAMAAGRPVVAAAKGGMVEIIENGESGFLVEPGSSQALKNALQRLLEDASLRERLAANALRRAQALFSTAAMNEKFLQACLRKK